MQRMFSPVVVIVGVISTPGFVVNFLMVDHGNVENPISYDCQT